MDNDDIGDIERLILDLWAKGNSPKAIAKQVGRSIEFIYQTLKKLQKAIIAESGIR